MPPLSPSFPTSIPSPNESDPRNEEAINFLPGSIIKLRYKMLPINIAGTRPPNWGEIGGSRSVGRWPVSCSPTPRSSAGHFHPESQVATLSTSSLFTPSAPDAPPVRVPPPYFVELTLSECQMNIRHDLGDVNCGRTMAMHAWRRRARSHERGREGEGQNEDGASNQETTARARVIPRERTRRQLFVGHRS